MRPEGKEDDEPILAPGHPAPEADAVEEPIDLTEHQPDTTIEPEEETGESEPAQPSANASGTHSNPGIGVVLLWVSPLS